MVQESRAAPVAGAFVVLLDTLGHEVDRALTGDDGGFTVTPPVPGRYYLLSAVVGWRATRSPAVTVGAGEAVAYTFVVRPQPVRLDTLTVTGERRCDTRADTGRAVVAVWEEARKALGAVSWRQQASTLRYKWIHYERTLTPRSLQVLDETSSTIEGMFSGGPFETLDPQVLWDRGFIRPSLDGGWLFEGPDARVFLSEQFAVLHCFGVVAHPDDDELIGLAFQPVADRKVPEIAGTLWLDRYSSELRLLEFQFVQLPWRVDNAHVGGHEEFQRLPTGVWIVRRWWLRMPNGIHQQQPLTIEEEGAVVTEIRTRDGHVIVFEYPTP